MRRRVLDVVWLAFLLSFWGLRWGVTGWGSLGCLVVGGRVVGGCARAIVFVYQVGCFFNALLDMEKVKLR